MRQALSSPPLLVTMGDPAGVGPELVASVWLLRNQHSLPPFAYLGDLEDLDRRMQQVGYRFPLRSVEIDDVVDHFQMVLPVLHYPLSIPSTAGSPHPQNAGAIISVIDKAVSFIAQGKARALVTSPIQKSILTESGFPFSGHTEYLGSLAERYFQTKSRPVMMLTSGELRVVPVTLHIPLSHVSLKLTSELIVETARICAHDLQIRFKIANPRIAICGLNPHAGERGTLGSEEETVIKPAVDILRRSGLIVTDPLPADTLFHPAARRRYDVVLCMYHDQALIPIKTIAFHEAVNVTLGLPFVRTSPDHGTALDLAATGESSPDSLISAIQLAAKLSRPDSTI